MNLEHLCDGVEDVIQVVRPLVEKLNSFQWTPRDVLPQTQLVLRAAARRQFDCLGAITGMVRSGYGYAGVPLLRPACEELIWIKYLRTLSREDADKLISAMKELEILASLEAQDQFGGRSETNKLGLAKYLAQYQRRADQIRSEIRALAIKLAWGKRAIEGGTVPSLGYLAAKTGETKRYNFLYHASSRFVHFSPTELLRRAWGKPGDASISSAHFSDYWSAFALHWGTSLLLETLAEVAESEPAVNDDFSDSQAAFAAAEKVAIYGMVPIITAKELAWDQ